MLIYPISQAYPPEAERVFQGGEGRSGRRQERKGVRADKCRSTGFYRTRNQVSKPWQRCDKARKWRVLRNTCRHRFWAHASTKEDLVFKVWVDPQDVDYGFDENFMRNISSYTRDCERENVAPSIFQILLFMYHSEIVLTPPFWLPLWILVGLHHVSAYWIGAGLLG
jgi:hypothetical protein